MIGSFSPKRGTPVVFMIRGTGAGKQEKAGAGGSAGLPVQSNFN
jgi:hypothetical protein